MVDLFPTRCAICNIEGEARELYPANFNQADFNPEVFSARRLPDRIHYRMVKCKRCGLVRADPVADPKVTTELYAQSSFNYNSELVNLKYTYKRYLAKLVGYSVRKNALLEIGCGNGFFLEEALVQGYAYIRGVEPSDKAIARARADLRSSIICGSLRPGLFKQGEFDVICMFQLFDHIANPGCLLDECFRLLKPNGLILCLNHNIAAIPARLLKERSPIVDIEHTYLYSPTTMIRIFTQHGFRIKESGSVSNRYTLSYLMRLIPLSVFLKRFVIALLNKTFFGQLALSVPLGNLYLIAEKPQAVDFRI